jgi:hypothetical protein
MEFLNRKKIQAKGAYFQVSTSVHEKYGKSLCLGIIPKKTENNKIMPNYDEVKAIFCSFNQASKIANKLFLAGYEALIEIDGLAIEKFYEYKVGKTTIEYSTDWAKKEVQMTFSNGDCASVIFDIDTCFVATDLIKSRLNDLEFDEDTTDNQLQAEENSEDKERKRLFHAIVKNSMFLNEDAVQDMLERGRKQFPEKSDVDILKEIGRPFGVE